MVLARVLHDVHPARVPRARQHVHIVPAQRRERAQHQIKRLVVRQLHFVIRDRVHIQIPHVQRLQPQRALAQGQIAVERGQPLVDGGLQRVVHLDRNFAVKQRGFYGRGKPVRAGEEHVRLDAGAIDGRKGIAVAP